MCFHFVSILHFGVSDVLLTLCPCRVKIPYSEEQSNSAWQETVGMNTAIINEGLCNKWVVVVLKSQMSVENINLKNFLCS